MSLFPTPLVPSTPYRLASRLDFLLRRRLWAQILLAMALGIGLGLSLAPSGGALVEASTANLLAAWLALPGRLFLAIIQMVVVPLVLSSIILGIASSGDADFLRRIGFRIAPYFLATTCVAVALGAAVALWLAPGQYITIENLEAPASVVGVAEPLSMASLPDQIIGLIPANPSSALVSESMFQIVVLAIFVAIALVSISDRRAKPLLDLCVSVQDISMKIVSWAMALAPAAVFGLLAQISVQVGFDAIVGVASYMGTVLLGLLLLLMFYMVIVALIARRSPLAFLRAISGVQLLAFSTSSRNAIVNEDRRDPTERFTVGIPVCGAPRGDRQYGRHGALPSCRRSLSDPGLRRRSEPASAGVTGGDHGGGVHWLAEYSRSGDRNSGDDCSGHGRAGGGDSPDSRRRPHSRHESHGGECEW